jgi:hypothetical protein
MNVLEKIAAISNDPRSWNYEETLKAINDIHELASIEIAVTHTLDLHAFMTKVVEADGINYDNPNGGYETTCPLCHHLISRSGKQHYFPSMVDFPHDDDCPFVIASRFLKG